MSSPESQELLIKRYQTYRHRALALRRKLRRDRLKARLEEHPQIDPVAELIARLRKGLA